MTAIINMSLYIPHIFANYGKEDVCQVFLEKNIGDIKNIDFIAKIGKDGKSYYSAYIHFIKWYDNKFTKNLQEQILNPEKEARLVYDTPWFWIILENKTNYYNC